MGYRLKSYIKDNPDTVYVVDVHRANFNSITKQHIAVMLEHQVNNMMLHFEKLRGRTFEANEFALQDNAGNVYAIFVDTEATRKQLRDAKILRAQKVYADDAWFVMYDAESADGDPRGTQQEFAGRTTDPSKALKFIRDCTENPYWCGHVVVVTDTESIHVSTTRGWEQDVVPALKFETEKEST